MKWADWTIVCHFSVSIPPPCLTPRADIHSLKEMTLLPLLYPEVFHRFNVTPPRGVFFHGPPWHGQDALGMCTCSKDGKQICKYFFPFFLPISHSNPRPAFFMRKCVDCPSKWVGEAERQLRLLFKEARNSQPSIILFDEIDGLVPVISVPQLCAYIFAILFEFSGIFN